MKKLTKFENEINVRNTNNNKYANAIQIPIVCRSAVAAQCSVLTALIITSVDVAHLYKYIYLCIKKL